MLSRGQNIKTPGKWVREVRSDQRSERRVRLKIRDQRESLVLNKHGLDTPMDFLLLLQHKYCRYVNELLPKQPCPAGVDCVAVRREGVMIGSATVTERVTVIVGIR
jgi:hypothetical protein